MSWTEEKVNKLKELWGKGQTASQIAEIIGGISRNAVIGKAHRLNLSAKIKTRSAINYNNSQKPNENSVTNFIKIFERTGNKIKDVSTKDSDLEEIFINLFPVMKMNLIK